MSTSGAAECREQAPHRVSAKDWSTDIDKGKLSGVCLASSRIFSDAISKSHHEAVMEESFSAIAQGTRSTRSCRDGIACSHAFKNQPISGFSILWQAFSVTPKQVHSMASLSAIRESNLYRM